MPAQTDTQPPPGILTRTTPADRGAVARPALAPHLQFRDIGERQTLLVSESFNTLLHGALHGDLLPLLDGRHPQDEIVAALEGAHAARTVAVPLAAGVDSLNAAVAGSVLMYALTRGSGGGAGA